MALRQPWWLLLLIPVAVYVVAALRQPAALRLSPIGRLKTAGKSWRTRLWWLPEVFVSLFLGLGVILIAGPQREMDLGETSSQGLAIALVLDRSGSMGALISYQNNEMTRLAAIRAVTADFVDRRPDDQFTLISFARYPETNTPLTANREIISDLLALISLPSNSDEDGTAIGDALTLATARLQKSGADRGVAILLTDGQNNQGEKTPSQAAEIARDAGITVYCVGLGGAGYVVEDTPLGPIRQMVGEEINEPSLKNIAETTGGLYYYARGPEDLDGFYKEIAARETEKLDGDRPRVTELNLEAGLVVMLILLAMSLSARHLLLRRMDQ